MVETPLKAEISRKVQGQETQITSHLTTPHASLPKGDKKKD
jgi:hypothetical protein